MGILNISAICDRAGLAPQDIAQSHCFVYKKGTVSLAPVFIDSNLTNTVANPIKTNANGVFDPVFLIDGGYEVIIRNLEDTALASEDILIQPVLIPHAASEFASSANLLSDTTLAYSKTEQTQEAGAGELLRTVDTGNVYRVLPADATDPHVTTQGGVKLAVEPRADGYMAQAFGAVGDGVADDTDALKAALTAAFVDGQPLFLKGRYRVTESLRPYGFDPEGGLTLICVGSVEIIVDPTATPFTDLLFLASHASNSCSISGGSLTIDGNDRVASGITFRHNAEELSGTVNIACPVTLKNFLNSDPLDTRENQALMVYGNYIKTVLNAVTVDGVARTNEASGASKGITIVGFTGDVVLNQPSVSNICTPGVTGTDADGIATFGKPAVGAWNTRPGRVVLNEPYFADCQGRSYKSQCSDVTINRPKVFRQHKVAISNAVEFDFQFGNGLVIEPEYEYRLNGGVSPLGSSHSCIAFQQVLDDRPMSSKSVGGVLKTEIAVPRYGLVVHTPSADVSTTEIAGLHVIPVGGLATTGIDRAILETDMSQIEAKVLKTELIVRDVKGPLQTRAIGYTGYSSGSLADKLAITVTDCHNVLAPTSAARLINSISGNAVSELAAFTFRNNPGFRDLVANGWTFDFTELAPGTVFTADLATVVASNAPPWGTTGYPVIEVLSSWFGATDKQIRVTKAGSSPNIWVSNSGGASWTALIT